jgi:predicted RNA binding protein YcfA (HicA-like mRNA interferase family)
MTKLPVIKPRQLEQVLLRAGFEFVRQKGSHRMYTRGVDKVVIPYHNKDLKKGTLKSVLKQANISVDELSRLP